MTTLQFVKLIVTFVYKGAGSLVGARVADKENCADNKRSSKLRFRSAGFVDAMPSSGASAPGRSRVPK